MKPFDIQKARAGAKVCTRDGKEVRIICFDRVDAQSPIIGLVRESATFERVYSFTKEGCVYADCESDGDLMLAPVKKKAWVLVYRDPETNKVCTEVRRFRNVIRLHAHYHGDRTIAVRKIEWEE